MEYGNAIQTIKVWDGFLRLFHWFMVSMVLLCWYFAGKNIQWHIIAGSLLSGLLLFRLLWGFWGKKYSHFSALQVSTTQLKKHLTCLLKLQSQAVIGHTALGRIMIICLLLCLLTLALSGTALMSMQMGIGILSGVTIQWSFTTQVFIENIHHQSFHILQWLVLIHISGVCLESLLQRQNLTLSMITGIKKLKENNL